MAKGLCFNCGQKYHPIMHKCPERTSCVLILGEGEILNEGREIISMEADESESEEDVEAE